jgi:hypothetical protein
VSAVIDINGVSRMAPAAPHYFFRFVWVFLITGEHAIGTHQQFPVVCNPSFGAASRPADAFELISLLL